MHLLIALNQLVAGDPPRGRADKDRLLGPVHPRVGVLALHPEMRVDVERHADGAVPAGVEAVLEAGGRERRAEADVDVDGLVVLANAGAAATRITKTRRQKFPHGAHSSMKRATVVTSIGGRRWRCEHRRCQSGGVEARQTLTSHRRTGNRPLRVLEFRQRSAEPGPRAAYDAGLLEPCMAITAPTQGGP